ncbi:MAG: Rrf2 family transcriptional regulator [Armatimonadota bacterium]|nr:MAG: Rrf2 family transcriptional regulator [Armatimonadota bacterium]
MKITAQEEYGLRCIMHLARVPFGDTVNVRQIAEHEGLSVAYVEKLLYLLNRAGLTESVRGAQGGYRLAYPAEQITLKQVLEALGGVLTTDSLCSQFSGDREICVHHGGCELHSVWSFVADYLSVVFNRITLKHLAEGEARPLVPAVVLRHEQTIPLAERQSASATQTSLEGR